MSAKVFFQDFEPAIREQFSRAVAGAGSEAQHLQLELGKQRRESAFAAEMSVTPPAGSVLATWAAVGSLWACAQGFTRAGRRMYEGKRAGARSRLSIEEDPGLKTGLDFLVFCQRLHTNDFPEQAGTPKWVSYLPPPQLAPDDDDGKNGNILFLEALGWIFRHEVAHVTLQHAVVADSLKAGNDADRQATLWLRGALRPDPDRAPGSKPSATEIQLEARAIATGVALFWLVMVDHRARNRAVTHPLASERAHRCFQTLEVREDSAAAEILSDTIQAWLDPEGEWAPPGGYPNALAALGDALDRLHSKRHDPKIV
ncbi:MAG TPA: phage exclusion protein Lit family protein [Magnetospirillaceae bacterium]|jgi:hypothetical protein